MPTLNPRTNVTLSPSLDHLVSRLAALQAVSKSQVLRELLEAAEPALQRAVALMEAASKATAGVHEGLARSLTAAQDKLEEHLALQFAAVDGMTADLVDQAQAIRGRRPGRRVAQPLPPRLAAGGSVAPVAPSNPPTSNRGVKSAKRGSSGVVPHGWTAEEEKGFRKHSAAVLKREQAAKSKGRK